MPKIIHICGVWSATAATIGGVIFSASSDGQFLLIERGHAAGGTEVGREALVRGLAGIQSYPADYLEELRDEWPD